MKSLILIITMLMIVPVMAFAQGLESSAALLKPVLEIALSYLPENVVAILVMIGGLRVMIKPIMSLFLAYSAITPSKKDDEIYKKTEEGNTIKTVKFVLDYIASIKVPPKK